MATSAWLNADNYECRKIDFKRHFLIFRKVMYDVSLPAEDPLQFQDAGELYRMGAELAEQPLRTDLGSVPVIWAALRAPSKVPTLALASTCLRVFALGAITAPVAILSDLGLRALLLWVAISYLVALGAEVVVLVLLIRRLETLK